MTINEFKQYKTKTENQNLCLERVEGNYKRKRNWNKLRNNVRPTPTSKANIKCITGLFKLSKCEVEYCPKGTTTATTAFEGWRLFPEQDLRPN